MLIQGSRRRLRDSHNYDASLGWDVWTSERADGPAAAAIHWANVHEQDLVFIMVDGFCELGMKLNQLTLVELAAENGEL